MESLHSCVVTVVHRNDDSNKTADLEHGSAPVALTYERCAVAASCAAGGLASAAVCGTVAEDVGSA
jgi:hypothetical protein